MNETAEVTGSFLGSVVGGICRLQKRDGSQHRVYIMPLTADFRAPALRVSSTTPLTVEQVTAIRGLTEEVADDWHVEQQEKREMRHDNAAMRDLFHRCWSRATASPAYQKADWKKLRSALEQVGYQL